MSDYRPSERRMHCWVLADRYLHALRSLLVSDDVWAIALPIGENPNAFSLVLVSESRKPFWFQRHLDDEARITDELIEKEMKALVVILNKEKSNV